MSEKQSGVAITVTTAVIAAALGLGIGNYAAKHEGFSNTADVSAIVASAQLDSASIPVAGSPAKGGENATATVVVFTDLQCKASRELYGQFFDSVFKTHGNNVRLVYKAFPLSNHENALVAAQAAQAAHAQGKFWPFFDAVYAASHKDESAAFLSPDKLKTYAQAAGLDVARFEKDMNSPEIIAAVQKDIDLGKRLGVAATPGVFINTQQLTFQKGVNKDELLAAVNQEITRIDGLLSRPNAKYALANTIAGRGEPALAAAPLAEGMLPGDALGRSVKGNPNALVTIVEFSDYQCPFCSRVEPTVQKILEEYPNDVRVVFTHNPLAFHKDAKLAAQAAYAAGKQGKFWEMHKILFENQKSLQRDKLVEYASQIGLDNAQFIKDLDDPQTAQLIDANAAEAKKFGFSGTPAFLINDRAVTGAQPYDNFKKAIDESLAKAKEVSQRTGLTGEELYKVIVKDYKPAPKNGKRQADRRKQAEPKILVDTADAPMLGNDVGTVPVTIVEFTDFQCPFCSRGNTTVKQLMENNPGKIRLVFRHNPLPFHKDAMLAHQAAEAAKIQGKFWEYYQILFDNQKELGRDKLLEYARSINLDIVKFEADMDSQAVKDRIAADLELSKKYSVSGTPHFFINGTRTVGALPIEQFQAAVDKEIEFSKKYDGLNLSTDDMYKRIVEETPKPAIINDGAEGERHFRREGKAGKRPRFRIPENELQQLKQAPELPNNPTP